MSDFVLDWDREARTGVAEAVLCEPKTPAQIAAILETAATNGARLLLTRLAPAQHDELPEALRRRRSRSWGSRADSGCSGLNRE